MQWKTEKFFSAVGCKNIFIGKCKDYKKNIAFAVQNAWSGKISILTDSIERYEMVD